MVRPIHCASWNPNSLGHRGQHLSSVISTISAASPDLNFPDIIFFQETRWHCASSLERKQHRYKGRIIAGLANNISKADGVAIILSERFIESGVSNISTTVSSSRAVAVRFMLNKEQYHLMCVYVPAQPAERQLFLATLELPFDDDDDVCLLAMDSNFVLDRGRDRYQVANPTVMEPGAREWIQLLDRAGVSEWEDLALLLSSDDTPEFTTLSTSAGKISRSRIDRVLSNDLAAARVRFFKVVDSGKKSAFHHIIRFSLAPAKRLSPPAQVPRVDVSIFGIAAVEAAHAKRLKALLKKPLSDRTGKGWSNICKIEMSTPLTNYKKQLVRKRRKELQRLHSQLAQFLRGAHLLPEDYAAARALELRVNLDNFTSSKREAMAVRFGNTWREEGEGRSSKTFYKFLKARAARGCITSIRPASGGAPITDNDLILQEFESFWGKIFASPDILSAEEYTTTTTPDQTCLECILDSVSPIIDKEAWPQLEARPSEEEITDAILESNSGSLPGVDGSPAEVYKAATKQAARLLVDVYGAIWDKGDLPDGFVHALVTFLYKKGPKDLTKNYRPISLLNSDYKILATLLVRRLAPLLHLSNSQLAFIKGLFIGEHLVSMDLVKKLMESRLKTAYVMFLDFAKAYDLVGWDFLETLLLKFGAPPSFNKVIMLLYRSSTFAVAINGVSGRTLRRGGGVLQGCPLSCVLFLLVVEAMAQYLEKQQMQGVRLGANRRILLKQFADDTASFHTSLEEGKRLLSLVQTVFCPASSMLVNTDKTFVLVINGSAADIEEVCTAGFNLANNNTDFKWLGSLPGVLSDSPIAWSKLIQSATNSLSYLCHRWMLPHARATTANALFLSRFWFRAQGTKVPTVVSARLSKLFWEYLWRGFGQGSVTGDGITRGRVRRAVCILPTREGGLNVKDPQGMAHAFAVSWLYRWVARVPGSLWASILETQCIEAYGVGFEHLLLCRIPVNKKQGFLPALWCQVISFARANNPPLIKGKRLWLLSLPIFMSICQELPLLRVSSKLFKSLWTAGLRTYGDLWNGEGEWHSAEELQILQPCGEGTKAWHSILNATSEARCTLKQEILTPVPVPLPVPQICLPLPPPPHATDDFLSSAVGPSVGMTAPYHILYSDGGARNNQSRSKGPSGAGFVLGLHCYPVEEAAVFLGNNSSNNVAEYMALLLGLLAAEKNNVKKIGIGLDSAILVAHLNGKAACRKRKLGLILQHCLLILSKMEWEAWHVLRHLNKRADHLANHAMDNEATWALSGSLVFPSIWDDVLGSAPCRSSAVHWWEVGSGCGDDDHHNVVATAYRDWRTKAFSAELTRNPPRSPTLLNLAAPATILWPLFWTALESSHCTAPAKDTLWKLYHGGLFTANRLVKIDPTTITTCLSCNSTREDRQHFFECAFNSRVWLALVSLSRKIFSQLWASLPPETNPPPGWVQPHSQGARFMFVNAFSSPPLTNGKADSLVYGVSFLQLLFIYGTHSIWRYRTNRRFHESTRLPPSVIAKQAYTTVISLLRFSWKCHHSRFRSPHLPSQFGKLLGFVPPPD